MRKSMSVLIALAVLAAAGAAWAAGTTTVAVSATVAPVCKFTGTGAIVFTLDPSVGGNVNGLVTQPVFWCTKGVNYTISDSGGLAGGLYDLGSAHRMKIAGAGLEYIPYSLTYTASGTGAGNDGTGMQMNIASQVLGTDYATASQGSYADTLTLSINP